MHRKKNFIASEFYFSCIERYYLLKRKIHCVKKRKNDVVKLGKQTHLQRQYDTR